MPLNDLLRVRCEKDLKTRLRIIARRKSKNGQRSITTADLAREVLLGFIEHEERPKKAA